MASTLVQRTLTHLGVLAARPIAFVVLGIYLVAWLVFDSGSMDMHGGAALAAWLMTLFIQRAAHRDTQAMQAKLDELLRAHGEARTEMSTLDDQEPEAIEARRAQERRSGPADVSIPKNQKH